VVEWESKGGTVPRDRINRVHFIHPILSDFEADGQEWREHDPSGGFSLPSLDGRTFFGGHRLFLPHNRPASSFPPLSTDPEYNVSYHRRPAAG